MSAFISRSKLKKVIGVRDIFFLKQLLEINVYLSEHVAKKYPFTKQHTKHGTNNPVMGISLIFFKTEDLAVLRSIETSA